MGPGRWAAQALRVKAHLNSSLTSVNIHPNASQSPHMLILKAGFEIVQSGDLSNTSCIQINNLLALSFSTCIATPAVTDSLAALHSFALFHKTSRRGPDG